MMQFRTDLAIERTEEGTLPSGVRSVERQEGQAVVTHISVLNREGAAALGKSEGEYITVTMPALSDTPVPDPELSGCIARSLSGLLPKEGPVLVVGLGNTQITPDALGPKTAAAVLATRHITGELARTAGLEGLRGTAVLAPGVLGQTGIESFEIVAGVAQRVQPSAIIAIDALASRKVERLGCTVQMSDTGISPGAGVGNRRAELSRRTLGVPVIALGVPTVVDAETLCQDLAGHPVHLPENAGMLVTPKEIDLLIARAAALLGHAINCALQPAFSPDLLLELARQ